jgi:signal transduction histidine kinase/FixJ family two-component response regulator
MSQAAAQLGARSIAGSNGVPRILVVDDEQHMCDICTRTLRRGGYEVFATNDPKVAVRELRSTQRFDLLLTDIKMPTMSGLDLARIAHEHDPAIAIIIMTGFASMENLQQSVQRGVADFLSKPFELEQLRLAVDQALHKRSILQDNLRLHTIEQLLQSSQTLNVTLDIDELAGILLRVGLQHSNCPAGFVLFAEDRGALKLMSPSTQSQLLDAGRGLAGRAFEEQRVLAGSDAVFCSFDGAEMRAALAVPLRAQGEVNGVLLLCDDSPGVLRPVVQEAVTLLANHAGAALRNAYLYSKLEEAYQRQQEVDRLKSEFIAIASHELRTPLSIVLGYTMMVRDQSEGERREYLQRVLDNAQRIKDIIDDMVSLRHIETGETTLSLEPMLLQNVVAQAIERMRPALDSRPQQIATTMPDEPLWFLCDHEKLILILSHLLSNAIKFTPEGGRIDIRASLRSPGALDSGDGRILQPSRPSPPATPWVVVEIQDTGIGIPEREQSRIFDRFYQVADSLTRDHGGTGLGLTLARELVGALGGAIWLTSHEGTGSTFTFALPYHQDQATNGSASISV